MNSRIFLFLVLYFVVQSNSQAQLIPDDIETGQWVQFESQGFDSPVSGLVFDLNHDICAGMPLGGLGTGCLDIETSGILGFSSIFRPSVMVAPTPYQTLRNPQLMAPFLGMSIGGQTWVLASQEMLDGGTFRGCIDPVDPGNYTEEETYMSHWRVEVPKTEQVKPAESIRYWGHYPVVDIDYETDAPVAVSLRAWSPFLPGQRVSSAVPGAIFEVQLTNTTNSIQKGRLAFNFPGPDPHEAGGKYFTRAESSGKGWSALAVNGDRAQYAIGILGQETPEYGGNLSVGGKAWSRIGEELPDASNTESGACAVVDFQLGPEEKKSVRFVLAWRVSHWLGGSYNEIKHFDETWTKNEYTLARFDRHDRSVYYPEYTSRYGVVLDVVAQLEAQHQDLLRRILAWQNVVFSDKSLPVWLQSALINNLSQFAENSLWAAPRGDTAAWAAPLGAFQMTECPRTCAIVGCIASNYYGDLPIAYFFPELERQILRGYVAYMRPDGAVPFLYPPKDFTKPSFEWQIALNGACFADLVHRLWLRTGDIGVIEEFYPAVKKNTEFTVGLTPGKHGIISFPREGNGQEWWEHTPVYGMVTHLAGVRLAQLRFSKHMADAMKDDAFSKQCDQWIALASKLTEENLWNEETRSYDFFRYPAKDMLSTDIMSSQLDGQWMVDLHGLPAVFRKDRIKTALKTIEDTCLVEIGGMAGFSEPGKGPDLARYGTFPPEVNIVAMTYMYNGQRELGLEIARRNMDNIIRVQGLGWDMPNLIRCDNGKRTYGADYYQNMVLWGLPAALDNQDLAGPCQSGGLVDRVLKGAASN